MPNILVNELLSFIDNSPSMFHATQSIEHKLEENNFTYLDRKDNWNLTNKGKYYTIVNNSCVVAFSINSQNLAEEGFRIIGTHADSPGFRIKPNAQMHKDTYIKLNTETYGGPILATWLDRPLSAAGRVVLKSDNVLHPTIKLLDFKEPIMVIPSLAIHMNRQVNEGIKLNPQKDMLPVLGYIDDSVNKNLLLDFMANKLEVDKQDIFDFGMYLYPCESSCIVGVDKQFISAPRLDNLSMTHSALTGFINGKSDVGINVFVAFDNEEVGSSTKQGANSPLLLHILERISNSIQCDREYFFRSLANSFIISADVAHLYHPNYPEKSDPTTKVLPGKGPAVKIDASCKYTTDSDSYSVFANLCKMHRIPYQVFVNRSDVRGGSTIGPITATQLGLRSIDIGTPMLAMHSARELMSVEDYGYTTAAMEAFYSLR
ncbi:MAG: aminopeptidase [Epulopiscium sp. Nele67-Bin002]|nr:MAG: aminopeptidase [Epulopiscium sp. Nele67-Bin002]